MGKEEVTIEIDEEAAQALKSASSVDRCKLEALVSLRLIEITKKNKPLKQIMKEISQNAKKRGFTLESLEEILNEKK